MLISINLCGASFACEAESLASRMRSILQVPQFRGSEIHFCANEKTLGSGAFAQVTKGVLRIPGQPEETVALKAINPNKVLATLVGQGQNSNYLNLRDIEDGFLLEASCLIGASQDCANIVKFHGIYQQGPELYFVMKFYQKTLKDQIALASPDQQLKYAIQMAHGLKGLHAKGFIHRDLKPDNFFIDEHDQLVIGDFGVSILQNSGRTKFIELGVQSRKYKSPEAVLNWQKHPEKTDDIYAFGLVLWQL